MSHDTATRRSLVYFASSAVMLTVAYPWLGNHVEPRVLGMPWSLVYVLAWIVANGLVLTWLHLRSGEDLENPGEHVEPTSDDAEGGMSELGGGR